MPSISTASTLDPNFAAEQASLSDTVSFYYSAKSFDELEMQGQSSPPAGILLTAPPDLFCLISPTRPNRRCQCMHPPALKPSDDLGQELPLLHIRSFSGLCLNELRNNQTHICLHVAIIVFA